MLVQHKVMKNWIQKLLPLFFVVTFCVVVVLRLWGLNAVPASLYWEEAALGYDAYSLLKTGKDHHGNVWPIVAVESFGDWKPAGYVYALIPFVQIFGLEPWVVRLPSALAGIAIVLGVSVLSGWLARDSGSCLPKEWQWVVVPVARLLGLIVAGFSPWALQFSRAGFEANLAAALITWSVILMWWLLEQCKAITQKDASKITIKHWLAALFSVILFVASVYTYHSARMVVPLLLLGVGGYGAFLLWKSGTYTKWLPLIVSSAIACVILSLPLLMALGSKTTTQRFAETSIFTDITVIEKSNALKEAAGNSWWSKILYHRYILFGQKVLNNYLLHWSPQYLFVSGDINPRHSTQMIGTLYHADLVVLIGTLWLLLQRKQKESSLWWFMVWWIVVGVLPASITLAAPHALRTLLMMPALLAVLATGGTLLALNVISWILFELKTLGPVKVQPWLRLALCVLFAAVVEGSYLLQFIRHWRYYSSVYPVAAAPEWQYGYKEMIQLVETYRSKHLEASIFISRSAGRPAMYYWFFTKTDPALVQAQDATAPQDQGEYLSFNNIQFIRALGEINKEGLVVMLNEEWQQFQTEGKWQTTIVAETKPLRAGQPYWIVSEVKK